MKSAGVKTGILKDGECNGVRSIQSGIEDGVGSRSNFSNSQHCVLDGEKSWRRRFRGIIAQRVLATLPG